MLISGISLLAVFGALGNFGEIFFAIVMLLMTAMVRPFGMQSEYGGFASFLTGNTAIFIGWIGMLVMCILLGLCFSLIVTSFTKLFQKKGI